MFRTSEKQSLPISCIRGEIIPYPPPLETVSIRFETLLISLGGNQPHDVYFTKVILEINMNIMPINIVEKYKAATLLALSEGKADNY